MEEYFGGEGLPSWLSALIDVNISNIDFILINAVAFTALLVIAGIHSFLKENNLLFLALVTLFFVNGLLHLVSSIFSVTYSPGTITGAFLYIPIGYYLFKILRQKLTEKQFFIGILLGILLNLVVIVVAWNI